ncbi:MAG: GAF domain-containing protein [Bacteroidota bacterium]|nr:GAF domain-containing protein [Bacteroidota bacterium]
MNKQELSVLILDNDPGNTDLLLHQFDAGNYKIISNRIETREELEKFLRRDSCDIIIYAYELSRFSVLDALSCIQESGFDIPVIVIADSIRENQAVELMRAGVHDIFLSKKLKRLIPAVEREVRDARNRESRKKTEAMLKDNEHRMRLLINSMREAYLIGHIIRDEKKNAIDWSYLFVNESYKKISSKNDLQGRKATEIYPDIRKNDPELFDVFDRVTSTGVPETHLFFFNTIKKWIHSSVYRIEDDEFAVVYEDVTEIQKARSEAFFEQQRIQDVLEISQKNMDSLDNMLNFAQEKIITLFESEYSFFSFYDEDKKEFSIQAWNKKGQKDCTIKNSPIIYFLEQTGAWGEVIRQRKSIIINNFKNNNPFKKGYPEGHVPIHRFLSVPIFNNGRIVATAGIANKKTEYTEFDAMQLSLMMDSIWKIAEWMKIGEDLKKSEEKFSTAFSNNPSAMGIISIRDMVVLAVNKAFENLTGQKEETVIGLSISEITDEFRSPDLPFLFQKALKKKHFSGEEFEFYKQNKEKVFVSVSAETIEFENKPCILLVGEDVTRKKIIDEEIKQSREQLKRYAAHLQSIREEERIILSRDLHDNLGQILTALRMDIYRISKKLDNNENKEIQSMAEDSKEMLHLVDLTLDTVRRISRDMRPRILDELGLIPAIQWQIDEFIKYSGIPCAFKTNIQNLSLSEENSIGVFRILQEALTNITRHSKATKAAVKIAKNKEAVRLVIDDNGIGISEEKLNNKNSLGLLSMSERASLFGGNLSIRGTKGKGTQITLIIPVETNAL